MRHTETQEEKKKKSKYLLLLLLLLITFLAVVIMIWALFFRDGRPELAPDYAPQETESNAESIPDDEGGKLESPQGGGSVSLTYSKSVTIDLSEEKASLLFANPGKSNQDMVVQLVIQEEVIIQSGTLQPGNQVTTLDLLEDAAEQLSAGVYEGNFNILFYNQESGEKAIVNTEIPVTISVVE